MINRLQTEWRDSLVVDFQFFSKPKLRRYSKTYIQLSTITYAVFLPTLLISS